MNNTQFDKLFHEIVSIKTELAAIREEKADKSDIDRILTTLDAIIGHYGTEEQERTALTAADIRHEERLEGHERRISTLEQRTA